MSRYQLSYDEQSEFDCTEPLGLMNLAGSIKDLNIKCRIIDLNKESRKLVYKDNSNYFHDLLQIITTIIRKESTSDKIIIGLQTLTNSHHIAIKLSFELKEIFPNSVVIFGGPHATLTAQNTMSRFSHIDITVLGEAEVSFRNLILSLKENRDISSVKGIMYRSGNDVLMTENQQIISDLDTLPFPDYSSYPYPIEVLSIEAGRGCPYNCTFCMTNKFFSRKYRVKSVERIINEIDELRSISIRRSPLWEADSDSNSFVISFTHDNLLADNMQMDQLIRALKAYCDTHKGFSWSCSARIDNLYNSNKEKELFDSGCTALFLGIETGSQKMQKAINKHLNIDKTYGEIEKLRKTGLDLTCSFINELPEENLEDYEHTLRLFMYCRLLSCAVQLHPLVIYPGTVLYEKLKDELFYLAEKENSDYEYTTLESNAFIREDPEIYPTFFAHPIRYESLRGCTDMTMFFIVFFPYTAMSLLYYSREVSSIHGLLMLLKPLWIINDKDLRKFFDAVKQYIDGFEYNEVIHGFLELEYKIMDSVLKSRASLSNKDEDDPTSPISRIGFDDSTLYFNQKVSPINFVNDYAEAIKTGSTPILKKYLRKKAMIVKTSANVNATKSNTYYFSQREAQVIDIIIQCEWKVSKVMQVIEGKNIKRSQVAIVMAKLGRYGLISNVTN